MSAAPQQQRRRRSAEHRVVVGVDGSEGATRALEWAASEADRTGALLELHAAYGPGYVFITPKEVKEVLNQTLEKAAAHVAADHPEVVTKTFAHEKAPVQALLEASYGAQLLVVGSRGLGGFKGLLLGSVSQQCAVHAHCPVLIVRPTEAPLTKDKK